MKERKFEPRKHEKHESAELRAISLLPLREKVAREAGRMRGLSELAD
jgi:hypothetical protein